MLVKLGVLVRVGFVCAYGLMHLAVCLYGSNITGDHSKQDLRYALKPPCFPFFTITGSHSQQDQILLVKMVKYMFFLRIP